MTLDARDDTVPDAEPPQDSTKHDGLRPQRINRQLCWASSGFFGRSVPNIKLGIMRTDPRICGGRSGVDPEQQLEQHPETHSNGLELWWWRAVDV